jgi:hypothetical protein
MTENFFLFPMAGAGEDAPQPVFLFVVRAA